MDKKHVSVAETAATLNISQRTVRQWIAAGKLQAKRHGKAWQIDAESVAKHLRENDSASERHDAASDCRLCQQRQSEIDYLRAELTEKNRQIEAQANQIDHLTQLIAVQTKATTALTEQLDAHRAMIEDLRHRPSLLKRLFRRLG